MGKMIDLTNQRFGKLTVIKNAGKIDGRRYYWECLCDCGKITVVEGSRLRSGNTKSCGCGKYDGLKNYNQQQSEQAKIPIGTKFGKLTVIEDLGFKPQVKGHNRRWYKCLCDCGTEKEVQGNLLKQGQTISCGKCISSKGEYLIASILDQEGVLYNREVVLPLLEKETKRKLRFDFVIYDKDGEIERCIEFDGRQHYYGPDTNYWGRASDNLDTIKEKDKLKNTFCLKHNIPLVRIPYWIIPTKENIFSDQYIVKGDGYRD